MPSSRIPSPARSQGTKSTPRRYKPRASRSVGSPARSTSSAKLSAMVQLKSFVLSPMPTRRSVLTDTTDIDIPRRNSWWKKLDENSREMMEVLSTDPVEANNAIEEYIQVDVLSQEKKHYTLDMPESSDGESINSIVIPQRKLFTQKESKPLKKFSQIIDNVESLVTRHKSQADTDKTLNVSRKNLLNKGSKQRNKPLFPSALLNISVNKTITNKTKELVATESTAQVKSLFGNKPGAKRKNMFADFLLSDSEDEIPEIQPKVFQLNKKVEEKRRQSLKSHDVRKSNPTSPTSSITDIEMDDWRHLPSSTMVEHQLNDALKHTPSKRPRLNNLSKVTEYPNTDDNKDTNNTKQSNNSKHPKSKSRNLLKFAEIEVNEFIVTDTNDIESDPIKEKNKSFKNATINKDHSKSKNISVNKVISEGIIVLDDKKADTTRKRNSKTSSKINQALQNDVDDNFTLVYENDDDGVENAVIRTPVNKATNLKNSSNINTVAANVSVAKQLQNSQSHNLSQKNQVDNENKQDLVESHNNSRKNSQSLIRNKIFNKTQQGASKIENNEMETENIPHIDQAENNKPNTSKYKKVANYEDKQIEKPISNPDKSDKHEARQVHNSLNAEVSNTEGNDNTNNISNPSVVDGEEMSVSEKVVTDEEISQQNHNASEAKDDDTNDNDQNVSQEVNISEEEMAEIIEEEIEYHDDEEIADEENINNEEDEELDHHESEEEENDIEMEQSKINKHYEVNSEIGNDKFGNNDHKQTKENNQNERRDKQVDQNQHAQDKTDVVINNYKNRDTSNRQQHYEEDKVNDINNVGANIKHDSPNRHVNSEVKVPSPEVILHHKGSQEESFTVQGRNTSVRKTKSIIKNLTLRPSLAPVRESTGFSDGSRNSSAEKSWDSHRTTRATLRQTFGKDFTPRKSLRELVMKKSAKRQTSFYEKNAQISTFPQANSTALPGSNPLALDDFEITKITKGTRKISRVRPNDAHKIDESCDDQQLNKSNKEQELNSFNQQVSHGDKGVKQAEEISKGGDLHNINESDHKVSRKSDQDGDESEINESNNLKDLDNSNDAQEISVEEADIEQEITESNDAQEVDKDVVEELNECDDDDEPENVNEMEDSDVEQEMNESDEAQEIDECQNENEVEDSDVEPEINESDEAQEINEFQNANEVEDSDVEPEINESDEAQEINESQNPNEVDNSDVDQNINESDDAPEIDESQNENEMEFSDVEQENNESDDEQEIECDDAQEVSADAHNMDESAQEMDESAQEMDESAREMDESAREMDESAQEMDESAQEMDDSTQEMGESENAQENNQSDHEVSSFRNMTDDHDMDSNYEESQKSRQTTLEMYLQKVKKQHIERKKQLEEEVMNSLKAPTRDVLNPFKVPAVPKQRRMKAQHIKPKAKLVKSSVISINVLPAEVLQDMKYKPPKRYRPTNASWITKRLYKFLETKLEPKYDYKARVRSEKLVETVYNFTKDIRRHNTAPSETVDALKQEMARLDVVKTHFEFYEFFHEYMPREVRLKVVPDVFNKIPLPKHGVFSDIIR